MRRAVLLLCVLLGVGACTPLRPSFLDQAGAAGPHGNSAQQILVTLTDREAVVVTAAGATPKAYRDLPSYGPSAAARRTARRLAREYGLREVAAWPIDVLGVHCIVYEAATARARDEILTRLSADPRVVIAQPMQTFATRSKQYDDPYLELQHGFARMQVSTAHRWSTGRGVRIAIIDSGIDIAHPDLAARIQERADFVPDASGHGEREQHGLAVAGVIGAAANNGLGIVGVAPEADLLAFRACWQIAGENSAASICNSFTLALALARAIEARAHIINLSLTGPRDPLLEQLLDRATAAGSILIGAVPPDMPAAEAFPTAHAAVIQAGVAEQMAVAAGGALPAPGIDVLTLRPGGGYDFDSGSSMAAAHVSGLVALLLAHDPQLTTTQIRRILEQSVAPVAQVSEELSSTVDACRAIAAVEAEVDCSAGRPGSRVVAVRSARPQ